MSGKSNRCQTWYYIRSYKYILKIYKPVQRQRKFSHVFGHTSENSSKTTLPAGKKSHICYEVDWHLWYSYKIFKNSILLIFFFHFLTRYIVDGYVKKATRSLDLHSHGFKNLNTVNNTNKIEFIFSHSETE